MESGCQYQLTFNVVPFAYRVHAHNLGRVISAYIVKENGETYELGRMSPQQPQVLKIFLLLLIFLNFVFF